MVRNRTGGFVAYDGREQFGSMLRRAYPLGLRSFEGLDEYFQASGAEYRMEESQQATYSVSSDVRPAAMWHQVALAMSAMGGKLTLPASF